ncbi:MAG: PD40 domain-containing protein, partial [Candidatus Eremiobacteraeota bacterium]|nr:PD40 domain-containing protein [Candidatus Eremiobacteraeota bacterium]
MKRGYTLIELIFAMALLALVGSAIFLSGRGARERAGSRALAERLASECRRARQQAMASGVPVAIAFPSTPSQPLADGFYLLSGWETPRVIRAQRLRSEYPGAYAFVGHWMLTSGTNQPGSTNLTANGGDFNLASWLVPDPSHAIYVFLPSGTVVANRPQFNGAYHFLACNGADSNPSTVGSQPSALLTRVLNPYTVKISKAGEVSLTPAAEEGVVVPGAPSSAGPSLPLPLPSAGSNADPILKPIEISPIPVPSTLQPGISANIPQGRSLTLTVRANDPDGDDLAAAWTCPQGGVFSAPFSPMAYDGSEWVGSVDFSSPPGAPLGSIFDLNVEVTDGHGGSASGTLGASNSIEVIEPTRIVYHKQLPSSRQIFIMNWDGTDKRQLTDNALDNTDPVLSPDGSKILYTQAPGPGQRELWVMNSDGTSPYQVMDVSYLTLQAYTSIRMGIWSPDGARIAFQAN